MLLYANTVYFKSPKLNPNDQTLLTTVTVCIVTASAHITRIISISDIIVIMNIKGLHNIQN